MMSSLDKPQRIKRYIVIALTLVGIVFAIDNMFTLSLFGGALLETTYLYILLALFLPLAFMVYPARKSAQRKSGMPPWYDILFSVLTLVLCIYLALHGSDMIYQGWSFAAPAVPTAVSVILWFLILEALRRAGGISITIVCAFFSFYPMFAPYMPGFMEGHGFSFLGTAMYHLLSSSSVVGLAMSVFATLLMGYLIFGAALQSTGGGKFFIDLASSLLGSARGGLAKVAIVSSALFGTMSGSVVSNVVSVGSITIPAMKKAGYPAYYAAAIEACSSTGGVIMPPVMGTTAFLISSFLGIPYVNVCIAAAIPSIIYYFCLFTQVDAYAAKSGLKGLSHSEIPPVKQTLKQGYPFALGLAVLIFFLVMKMEAQAPFYASLVLIGIAIFRKRQRFTLNSFLDLIASLGKILTELLVMMAGIGFVLGAFTMTGLGNSLAREIVDLAGGNLYLLLLFGALASFVLGLGMTITACYVFIAITLAPALVRIGLDPLAVHLFVMYWGMISFITPPVAIGAYVASGVAGAPYMKTGFQAMKLGVAIYFLPFIFVLNPSLILNGPPLQIVLSILSTAVAIFLIGASIEGFMLGLGRMETRIRPFTLVSGILMGLPWPQLNIIGLGLAVLTFGFVYLTRRIKAAAKIVTS